MTGEQLGGGVAAGQPDDPVQTAEQLAELLRGISRDLDAVRRLRRLARWLVASVVLTLASLLALGVVVFREHQNGSAIRDNQIHACRIGNDARDKQRLLWGYVLSLSSQQTPRNETPAEREQRLDQIRRFRLFVNKTFRDVDCVRLYQREHS